METIDLKALLQELRALDYDACPTLKLLDYSVQIGMLKLLVPSTPQLAPVADEIVRELLMHDEKIRQEVVLRDTVYERIQSVIENNPDMLAAFVMAMPLQELMQLYQQLSDDAATDEAWAEFRNLVGEIITHRTNSNGPAS